MKQVLFAIWMVGCVALSVRHSHTFSSDLALWDHATPTVRPRVAVNLAAALIHSGDMERGAWWAVRAVQLSERPASAYERDAVRAIVQRQLRFIQLVMPICDRPSYHSHC